MKAKVKAPEYGSPDEENPEVTAAEFKAMRPIGELLAQIAKPTPANKVKPAKHPPRIARAA